MYDSILDEVTFHYLESGDFQAITAAALIEKLSIKDDVLHSCLFDLIENGAVKILFGKEGEDLHLLGTGNAEERDQIEALSGARPDKTFVYPTDKVLRDFVVPANFASRPYTLALALGDSPFSYRTFDLTVLEEYRDNPQFYYVTDDISGIICAVGDSGQDGNLSDLDRILVGSFGFCYDEALNRGVAVFLTHLSQLPAEHQLLWKSNELPPGFEIHPDYYRLSLSGEAVDHLPILKAILLEIYVINQMTVAMSRPKLFRVDFGEDLYGVPEKFTLLIRPTAAEYYQFLHLLDELLVQNIDVSVFKGEVSFEQARRLRNGAIVVEPKGGLQVLDSWVRANFRPRERAAWDEAVNTFYYIRSLRLIHARQATTSGADADAFDQQYFRMQREVVVRAYKAIRTLRQIVANHPKARRSSNELSSWLVGKKIITI